MSNLDDQLKELKNKKLKSEFLKIMKSKISDVTGDDFKGIEKEVKDEVFTFFDDQISNIESGQGMDAPTDSRFSESEVKILKTVADRVAESQITPVIKNSPKTPLPTNRETPLNNQDKMAFAMGLRHLDSKDVKIKSMDNAQGVVVGLDAPYVIVKLATGVTVNVYQEDILL